jgi:polysaccharide export outer membrane protein
MVMFRVIIFAVTFCLANAATFAQTGSRPALSQSERIRSHNDEADPAAFELWSSGRYRLMASDVIEVSFPDIPEFNQVLTVQPDGYVTLQAVGDVRVQGRTLPELRQMLLEVYEPILREPLVTVTLKEFEKPFFIAAGEVKQPGKFDLRGPLSLSQALAVAGGAVEGAKLSQVILFRRYSQDLLEVKQIDVKKMLASHDLSEDPLLRPGDTLFVPKSTIARLKPFIPVPGIGMYLNPLSR